MKGMITKRLAFYFILSFFFSFSSVRFASIDKRSKVVGNGRFRRLLRYCVIYYFMILEYCACKGRQQQQTIATVVRGVSEFVAVVVVMMMMMSVRGFGCFGSIRTFLVLYDRFLLLLYCCYCIFTVLIAL